MRTKGTFDTSFSLEPQISSTLDARQLVPTKAELVLEETWNQGGQGVFLPVGFFTSVWNDADPANNGLYILKDTDYKQAANWERLSAGGSSTPVPAFVQSFTQDDLSADALAVSHNLGTFTPIIMVYNQLGSAVIPYEITSIGENTARISFETLTPIEGTWKVVAAGGVTEGTGGIEEAPIDGNSYVRSSENWALLPPVASTPQSGSLVDGKGTFLDHVLAWFYEGNTATFALVDRDNITDADKWLPPRTTYGDGSSTTETLTIGPIGGSMGNIPLTLSVRYAENAPSGSMVPDGAGNETGENIVKGDTYFAMLLQLGVSRFSITEWTRAGHYADFTNYTAIDQLGFSFESDTLLSMCQKMKDKTSLSFEINDTSPLDWRTANYPSDLSSSATALIEIKKYNNSRCQIEIHASLDSLRQEFLGLCDDAFSLVEWSEILLKEAMGTIERILSDHYLAIEPSQLGSVTSGTLAGYLRVDLDTIGIPQYSTADLRYYFYAYQPNGSDALLKEALDSAEAAKKLSGIVTMTYPRALYLKGPKPTSRLLIKCKITQPLTIVPSHPRTFWCF